MDIETKKYAKIDQYILKKCLGQGYNAKVKLAFNPEDNKYYAIKVFKKTHAFETNRNNLIKEFQAMKSLSHPLLINLVEIKADVDYVKKSGQTYKTLAIVLEYAQCGELFEFVDKGGQFPEPIARTYFHQLIEGLNYLHQQGIAHRDIKPENLLFDDQLNLKIADFGFAASLAGKDGSGLLKTVLGTEGYMAPEIIEGKSYSGTAVDLFASGVVLFIMITGHPPFSKADPKACPYYKCLATGRYEKFWEAHSRGKPQGFFSPDLINFFNRIFSYDASLRPSVAEILALPWFNGPTLTIEQIRHEFKQRAQLVEQQLEKQRIEKQIQREQQKQQQQNSNFVMRGANKFRSEEEPPKDEDFLDELSQIVPNIRAERKIKKHIKSKGNEFSSYYTKEYILQQLLLNKDKFCQEISLSDNLYKLKCGYTNNEKEYQVNFSIELTEGEDEQVFLNFTKVEGESFNFVAQTKIVQELLSVESH